MVNMTFMIGKISLSRKSVGQVFFALGLIIYSATALINIGIIALDDYDFGIARTIPAQTSSYDYIITGRDIRTPIPTLILAALGKIGLAAGLTDPVHQFKFILLVIGLISFLIQSLFIRKHFSSEAAGFRGYKLELAQFLVSFYFLCPLFFTRPLVENLSGPFLIASAYLACAYYASGKRGLLCASALVLMLGAMIRFQSGICFLGLVSAVLLKRNLKDLGTLIAVGIFAFLFSGGADWLITGHFHGSLIAYLDYNLHYSSIYGVQPFYVFILLFFALTIPPTLIVSYKKFNWKKEYEFLVPTVLFFAFFLLAHTLVPHKEERFMVPVLGLFLVLIVPLMNHVLRKGFKQWRVNYFLGINFLFLPLASFNIAQNNTVGLVRFLHHHTEIKTVIGIEDTLLLFPKAFLLNEVDNIKMSLEEVNQLTGGDCNSVIAIRQEKIGSLQFLANFYHPIAEFKPGFLEYLLVKANPLRNGRRGAIILYADKSCQF